MEKKKSKKKKVVLIVLVFLIVSMVIGYVITASQMDKNFGRIAYPDTQETAYWMYDHYEKEYPRESVEFKSGENTLKGFIYGMDNDKGLVVFAHGIGRVHERYLGIIIRLVDRGWRVLAYDATGCGYSEGDGSKGLAQSVIDLDKALDFAESDSRLKDMNKYVLGHSWGGYAAAAVLNFDHDIKACVTLSGYNSPFEKLTEFCDEKYGIAGKLLYPIIWTYNKVTFGKDSSWEAAKGINKSGIPVEVVHGTEDETISYEHSAIMAHKDEITNPNVKYVTYSDEGRNGHSSYFQTAEYAKYEAENRIDERLEELEEKYDDKIPHDKLVEYYSSIDKELFNEYDEEFIDMIDDFFNENLK